MSDASAVLRHCSIAHSSSTCEHVARQVTGDGTPCIACATNRPMTCQATKRQRQSCAVKRSVHTWSFIALRGAPGSSPPLSPPELPGGGVSAILPIYRCFAEPCLAPLSPAPSVFVHRLAQCSSAFWASCVQEQTLAVKCQVPILFATALISMHMH